MPTKEIAGTPVEVNDEGYLVNPDHWTEAMAPILAKEVGIEELTDRHWAVLHFLQKDFKEKGAMPTIRRVKNTGGIPTKELYELFPGGPLKLSSMIAGLEKPKSCI